MMDTELSFSTNQCYILNMQATYLKVGLVWCAPSASGRGFTIRPAAEVVKYTSLIVSDRVCNHIA